jgi:hypothetical protein
VHDPLKTLCDFGHFEINKRDLGRQRENRILVAEEEILHEIKNQVLSVLKITWEFSSL